MTRIRKFTSVFGEAWVVGRYLIPRIRALGEARHEVVLDLACGESPFRGYFGSTESYLRMDRHSDDRDVTVADMHAIPLDCDCVDLVILFQALSDVPEPSAVLKEIGRVLRPGGRVAIFESMSYPEHDMPFDFYRIMPKGLDWIARESGFETEECVYLGGLFTRFASLWADFIMGGAKRYRILRPITSIGTALGNIACYAMDKLVMRNTLASDYFAVLRLKRTEPLFNAEKQGGA